MNKKTLLLLCILLVKLALISAQSFDITQPLPADQGFVVGQLDNGLTYYIKETDISEDKADFFIVHNVGSMQEEDNQRGLAHFLEHMAFNGTENFPDKDLLNYFTSIGVRFGSNVNAYTSMDRTVYIISEVPVSRSSVIDTTLLALHDWSHYISLIPEEIDNERGVVREEMRRGDAAFMRMMNAINNITRTGSRFADRTPIGTAEVVENFKHEELIDFYHRWYRPSLQAVIVVGDIDAEDIEQRIIERFSTIPRPENEEEKIYYTVPDNVVPIVGYFTDPETKAESVRITVKIPNRPIEQKETYAYMYDKLVADLFAEIMKARFTLSAKKDNPDYRVVIPVFGEIDYACRTFTSTAVPAAGKDLYTALKGILEEFERARQYGMTDMELENAKAIVSANLIGAESKSCSSKTNRSVVEIAVEHFTRNTPLLDTSEMAEIAREVLDKIELEDINENIELFLNENNRVIIFAAPESEKDKLPSKEKVLALVETVQNTDLGQYTVSERKEFEISGSIKNGKILDSRLISLEDLGMTYDVPLDSTTEFNLSNGARVIWKETYDNTEKVRFYAFTPGGYARKHTIEESKILNNYLRYLNVGNLNLNELREWKHINNLRISQVMEERIDRYSGEFYPDNNENFFKLLYSYFTDAYSDDNQLEMFREQYLKNLGEEVNEKKIFDNTVKSVKFSVDPRVVHYDSLYIKELTTDKIDNLYRTHFANPAEYTFIFIGPMSANDAVPLLEKYVASIEPDFDAKDKTLNYKNAVLNKGDIDLTYNAASILGTKASVSVVYHTDMPYNMRNFTTTLFLRDILSNRCYKSIREDRGGTYHVGVRAYYNLYPEQQLAVEIDFETKPSMIEELLEVANHEAIMLAEDGPTDKEIAEVKKYRLKTFDEDRKVPWTTIISRAILNEDYIDPPSAEMLDSISVEDVQEIAEKIFNSGNKMTFVFDPKNSTAE